MLEPKKVIKNGKETWMIQLPIYEGQRTRLFFPSRGEAEKDAEKYGKEVKQAGEYWARLEPGERLAIQVVHTQVKKAGLTMTKRWEDVQAANKETDANAVKTPRACEKFVTEWKRRRKNAGKFERYVYHAAADLMKFLKGQEWRPIDEIRAQELERATCEQLHSQVVIQSQDLGAHGGLLDAIGHVSNGFTDAAVFGRVISKLDMVDVHSGTKVPQLRFYQYLHTLFQLTPRRGAGVSFGNAFYTP